VFDDEKEFTPVSKYLFEITVAVMAAHNLYSGHYLIALFLVLAAICWAIPQTRFLVRLSSVFFASYCLYHGLYFPALFCSLPFLLWFFPNDQNQPTPQQ